MDAELGVGEIRARLADVSEVLVEVWAGAGWYAAAQPGCPNGGVWPRGGYQWGWHPGHTPVPPVPGVPAVPPVPYVPGVPPVPGSAGAAGAPGAAAGWAWAPGHGPIPPGHGYAPGYGAIPPGHGYVPGYGAVPGGAVPAGETVAGLADLAVSFDEAGGRLLIGVPQGHPLWSTALAVDITVPARSRLNLRTGSGSIAVAGTAAAASLTTGSGSLDVERSEGDTALDTGSGSIAAGHLLGNGRLRTGSGSVGVGTVEGEVSVQAGTGQIAVGRLASGALDAFTSSGEIRIGVRAGVAAEVDAHSGSGGVRNDLADAPAPAAGTPPVRVRARTGSGRVWIARAA
ncbi:MULTISPECIES: DUF4097 family beta strand repeat-containing protein [unclassified Streptomyces]|uniref:DUF4097 family beta strand repeat-containing protein n=1 Tax=unclassified Streptomyces TaxID=2593676 RepID=UPI00278C05EC|nr:MULTISPECIES: DUF4097 family beta strand repeat-containing protein [unclassified Streptomyces]